MSLHFHVGRDEEARDLIETYHYSGRWPGNVQVVGSWHEDGGLFGDAGPIVAACIFSIPPTRWSENVLELSRLCRREDVRPQLSGLIAETARWTKKFGADLLVSFADDTHNHHGGIYQACSWAFDGKRERRMDGLVVNGEFVAGRSANSRWGTRSPSRLQQQIGAHHEIVPHYDAGKYLYWRALTRAGRRKAQRLGLQAVAYPKPHKEIAIAAG